MEANLTEKKYTAKKIYFLRFLKCMEPIQTFYMCVISYDKLPNLKNLT